MESENSVMVSAPSVEEAIIIGLTRLTAMRHEVDIEVLDEGSKGFLGIGSREARVRVTRRPQQAAVQAPATPPERVSKPEPAPAPKPEPASAPEPEAATVSRPEPEGVPQPEPEREPESRPARSPAETPEPVREREVASAREIAPPRARQAPEPTQKAPESDRERRDRRSRPPRSSERSSRRDDTRRPQRAPRPVGPEVDREKLEAVAKEIVANMLPGLEIETATEWVEEERPTLWVSIGGRDADALVGPRARNLHAAQYLIRALIYRRLDGNYNVVVDADGYRRRRRRSLETLAQDKADRAVELGRTIRLRPMPAHERRIVHITLRQDERVTTESVGKGRDRAVTIVPKTSSDATD